MMSPGVYTDLPNPAYHAETDWVSSSMLKAQLPEHYKGVGDDTPAKDFGTAFHTTTLGVGEPIEFVDALSWTGKAAKEEQAAIRERGNTPLLKKDWPIVEGMASAVCNHREANELLHGQPGGFEVSVFVDVGGVPCRARFDKITDAGVGIDLKSTSKGPGEYQLTRAITEYGYDVSAWHYRLVAAAAEISLTDFLIVFCSKEPPHYVSVVELDQGFYDRAETLRTLALDRLQHPEMVESYPGANGRMTVCAPRWAMLG